MDGCRTVTTFSVLMLTTAGAAALTADEYETGPERAGAFASAVFRMESLVASGAIFCTELSDKINKRQQSQLSR